MSAPDSAAPSPVTPTARLGAVSPYGQPRALRVHHVLSSDEIASESPYSRSPGAATPVPEAATSSPRPKKTLPEEEDHSDRSCFMQFLIREKWSDGTLVGLRDDLFAGITLAMTQVPPAVGFSLLGHLDPLVGLYSSFFIGVIMSCTGGRPGLISAAAGALTVTYPPLTDKYGPDAVYAMSILAGVLMTLPGILGFAKYVRLIPGTVMIGFVNGLACVLAREQIPLFKTPDGDYVTGAQAGWTAMLTIVSFSIMMFFPYVTKLIPSTFVAIVVGTALEHIFQLGTVTLGDLYNVSGAFPTPRLPDVDLSDGTLVGMLFVHAIIVLIIGTVESLLTVHIVNVLTESKGSFERESIALGCSNIVCGFFGTYAGCVVFGPTILNFHSGGGKRRVAGFFTGCMMMIVVLAAYRVFNWFPMGSLAAVIFGIAVKTFDWRTFDMIFKMKVPVADSLTILTVASVTVFTDLAIAVGTGIVVAILFFAWDMFSGRLNITVEEENETDEATYGPGINAKVLHMHGTLFFMSASEIYNKVERIHHAKQDEGSDVILDFGTGRCSIHDFSSMSSLNEVGTIYTRRGRRFHLRNLDAASEVIASRARNFTPDIFHSEPGAFDQWVTITLVDEELLISVEELEQRKKDSHEEEHGPVAPQRRDSYLEGGFASIHVEGNAAQASHQEPIAAYDHRRESVNRHRHAGQDGENGTAPTGEDENKGKEEEKKKELTLRDVLDRVDITFTVFSKQLQINAPLAPMTYDQLVDEGVENASFRLGFNLRQRFEHISIDGDVGILTDALRGELVEHLKDHFGVQTQVTTSSSPTEPIKTKEE